MTHRLVHILSGLGVTLLAFGGWTALTHTPHTLDGSTTQRHTDHASSSPSAPTPAPSSASHTPTTPNAPTARSSTSPSSTPTSTSQTTTNATSTPRSPRAERARAVKTARAFLSDLTARERDPKQWWGALEPRLSPQARTDMAGMEPDWIPPLELTPGGGVVVDEDAPTDAHQREVEVTVPTTSGWAGVILRPTPGGDAYVVVRYDLPEGH